MLSALLCSVSVPLDRRQFCAGAKGTRMGQEYACGHRYLIVALCREECDSETGRTQGPEGQGSQATRGTAGGDWKGIPRGLTEAPSSGG